MKVSIFIFLFVLFSHLCFAQKLSYCKKCKYDIKNKYLLDYSNTPIKLKTIQNNWTEYFFQSFDFSLNDEITPHLNIVNLRFDGLGCVYPRTSFEFVNNKKIESVFKNSNRGNFDGISFFNISENTYSGTKKIFWNQYLQISKNEIINQDRLDSLGSYRRQFEFIKMWNEYFLKKEVENLEKIIIDREIERIVILVHGYNVPYSLAKIQYENIVREFDNKTDCKKILFLNIFWPSTSEKKITETQNGIYFKNKLKWSVISNFKNVVPRTYYVSIGLRKFLNLLNFNGDYSLFSHSLGANIISSTLIEPNKKLQRAYRKSKLRDLTIAEFRENKLNINPRELSIFTSAPAIGGVATFQDLDSSNNVIRNSKWIIGYNKNDKVLNRTIGRLKFKENGDNTRLGGDKYNEIRKTNELLKRIDFDLNIKPIKVGIQKDQFGHDFFCYLYQPLFQEALNMFIKNQFPR